MIGIKNIFTNLHKHIHSIFTKNNFDLTRSTYILKTATQLFKISGHFQTKLPLNCEVLPLRKSLLAFPEDESYFNTFTNG